MEYTLQDIFDAVQYGFDYRGESQNDGKRVPLGNTLQWLMSKKGLVYVPDEFKEIQEKKRKDNNQLINVLLNNTYGYKSGELVIPDYWDIHRLVGLYYYNTSGFFGRTFN